VTDGFGVPIATQFAPAAGSAVVGAAMDAAARAAMMIGARMVTSTSW
jgi:hypothetical protein